MLRKLGKQLTNNFGLKVLAALFAVVLWLVVLNIDDPIKGKTVTTSVTLVNTEYITSMGKYYEVLGGTNTVSFYFTAERSVWEKTSGSDFTATADMEKIEYDEKTESYRVPVTVTPNKNTNSIKITTKQLYIDVALEDRISTQLQIKANTTGTVADGCALGAVEIANTNVIKISGPASVVSTIESATATINVDGMSTDITDSVVPVLYDADGNIVDTTKLQMSVQTVSITAQILNTKDVAIEFQTTGTVAEGYRMEGITYDPEIVRIKGEAAVLNTLDKITVPADVLDVTDATEDIVKTIDITSYLPNGVSFVISSDAKIDVTVTIEKVETKTYQVPVTNLTVEGLESGYRCVFDEEYAYIDVNVTGGVKDLEALSAEHLTGKISVANLGTGTHHVAVQFELDEELYQVGAVSVAVTLEEKENSVATSGSTNDSGSSSNGTTNNTGSSSSGTTSNTGSSSSGNTTGGQQGTSGAESDSDDTVETSSGNTTQESSSEEKKSGSTSN